jgi:hypothetical protein
MGIFPHSTSPPQPRGCPSRQLRGMTTRMRKCLHTRALAHTHTHTHTHTHLERESNQRFKRIKTNYLTDSKKFILHAYTGRYFNFYAYSTIYLFFLSVFLSFLSFFLFFLSFFLFFLSFFSFFLSYSDLFLPTHCRCRGLLSHLIILNDTHTHTHHTR